MRTSTLLVVTSYSLPNQALRAMLETLATKHPRGIGLTTGKEFLETTRYQSNQYRQLSTLLRLRKQTNIHRIMLHRSTAAGTHGIWVNQKTWAKTPWESEASGEGLRARCFCFSTVHNPSSFYSRENGKRKGVKSKRGSETVRAWKEAEMNAPGCRNQDGDIKTFLLGVNS